MLKDHFVVGWKNIMREDFVGSSHGYGCDEAAVGTTNGAGPRNTQIFVLAADGTVLHCLPGFWHPEDLAHELEMARVLDRLWRDGRNLTDKRALFRMIQLSSVKRQPAAMVARSGWQGFDAANERERLKTGPRDTFVYENGKPVRMKPLSLLVRERMAARPFVALSRFDTDAFIDYGRPYYDNNAGIDGKGVEFGSKGYMESQKRMAERRKEREAEKQRVDDYYGRKKEQADKEQADKELVRRPTSRPARRQ